MIGKIRILHISDIHYSKKDLTNFNELVQKPLFESLKENTKEELIDLICISGDLINQGTGGFDSTEEAFYEFKN